MVETVPARRAAVEIAARAMEAPGEIAVLALGRMTNVALALRLAPEIADALAGVVVMGGAVRVPGNVSPVATANIHEDPEAAAILYDSGAPIIQVGLDVCDKCGFSEGQFERLRTSSSPAVQLLVSASAYTQAAYRRLGRLADGEAVRYNDVPAVAAAVDPSLMTMQRLPVAVDTGSDLTRGQTVVDWYGADRPGGQRRRVSRSGRRATDGNGGAEAGQSPLAGLAGKGPNDLTTRRGGLTAAPRVSRRSTRESAQRGNHRLDLVVIGLVDRRISDPVVAHDTLGVDNGHRALGGNVAFHARETRQGNVVSVYHLTVVVAQESVVDVVGGLPGSLGEGRINGDADNRGVHVFELADAVAQGAHLGGADAGERAGEEGKHDVLAAVVAQTVARGGVFVQGEIGVRADRR